MGGHLIGALTLVTAFVWLLFGLGFKILGLLPRHRLIVAAVLGEAAAGPITLIIGAGERQGLAAPVSVVRLRLEVMERATFQHIHSFSLHVDVGIPDLGIRDRVRVSGAVTG
jgi:hypothetical protein